ncbi:MAG: sensor histidine kinase, partial [Deltaproteobacteria bacterium]|nr:sensor histidine kinase [Deltaproteobacteria bacterium]
MKLSVRLLLNGAVVPAGLVVCALMAVGFGLHQLLRQSVDRALLAQAAVESVSLFDRPDGAHLHVALSPVHGAQGMTAWAALYGPDGALRMKTPAQAQTPEHLLGAVQLGEPYLEDQPGPGPAGQRVLVVGVPGPDEQVWRLRLAQPLELQRSTMGAYTKAAALVGLLVLVGLFTLQIRFGRQLNARIERLAQHLRRLHRGDLDHQPAPDASGDVLSELRDLAQSATQRLRQAREDQQRLVADAAHELRTPLAVLRTDVDVTLRRERPPEQLREALERARDEVDRLAKLANDLL